MPTDLLAHKEVAANLELFCAWVEAQLAQREQPGIAVGLIYDQSLIWSRGFGYANVAKRVPMTAQTICRIASITKLFTSTAIMQLRDDGLLQLDDPVKKHLPWFQLRNPHPDTPVVTIRHLLAHAGGLPREAAFPYWSTNEFPSVEEVQAALPDQEFALPTGSDWKYSNLSFMLAGEIVAAVAKLPYNAYVTEKYLATTRADQHLCRYHSVRSPPPGGRLWPPAPECGPYIRYIYRLSWYGACGQHGFQR